MGLELLLPLMIVALIALMVLQGSKQRRALRALKEMQDSLVAGDQVLTTSGLHATISAIGEESVDLEIAPGVRTRWDRRVIREKLDATTGTGTGESPGADASSG